MALYENLEMTKVIQMYHEENLNGSTRFFENPPISGHYQSQ